MIGIRREDKNEWERRVPLIPSDLKELNEQYGIKSVIQPSKIRYFKDEEFEQAGVEVSEDLSKANVIFAVKEIPNYMFRKDKTYVFFSHTIKGQAYNMPMLRKMMDHGCNLIDYERIVNEKNQRLIFFGRFAGNAGMIETLHIYGQKLKLQGHNTPLANIKQPFQYSSLDEAKKEIRKIGEEIKTKGFPPKLTPIIIGISGYGNVSKGAQEILNILPHKVIPADMLTKLHDSLTLDTSNIYVVVFKEEDMFRKLEGGFDLNEYYNYPERYVSQFGMYIPFLTILVNCIYWSEKYPRLITKKYLQTDYYESSRKKLQVIGDISCDIDGAVEICYKITKPDNPSYTYDFTENEFEDGILPQGITVMAVDNLPCEFPGESSGEFSRVLKTFVKDIAEADFSQDYDKLDLPDPLKNALVLHRGELTEPFKYLEKHLQKAEHKI